MPVPQARTYASPEEALREAVVRVGSQAAMARLIGVAQPSVWRWLKQGHALPGRHVLAVEKATGISRHDLNPVFYPLEPVAPDSAPANLEPAR